MSRVCEISGKNVMSGNNVSHAKNKTKRKFLPNLQNVKFFSKSLDKSISMKVSVRALKSVEKNGGLDDYLSKTSNRVLAPQAIAIKKSIQKNLTFWRFGKNFLLVLFFAWLTLLPLITFLPEISHSLDI